MKTPQRKKTKDKTPDPYEFVKNEVRNILGINETEHNEMLYEDGLRRLDEIPKDRRELVYIFQNSSVWWEWFKNAYYLIDIRFVREMILSERYQRSRKEALSYYKHLHEHGHTLIWDEKVVTDVKKKELVKQSKKRNHG